MDFASNNSLVSSSNGTSKKASSSFSSSSSTHKKNVNIAPSISSSKYDPNSNSTKSSKITMPSKNPDKNILPGTNTHTESVNR